MSLALPELPRQNANVFLRFRYSQEDIVFEGVFDSRNHIPVYESLFDGDFQLDRIFQADIQLEDHLLLNIDDMTD
jgi:hypothetical protein